jgi:hypothetical protein
MGPRLPTRFNAAGVNHIRLELDYAIGLCDAAKAAASKTKVERLLVDASSVYSVMLKLIPRVQLSSGEAQEIQEKRLLLNSLLQEFGSLVAA